MRVLVEIMFDDRPKETKEVDAANENHGMDLVQAELERARDNSINHVTGMRALRWEAG